MGYKFTMCPCNNQPNVKEKHFKPLLSTALAKWAWVQLSPVPWLLVPRNPTAMAAFCTPTLPRQLSPSPGTAPVECRCSSHDPNLSLTCSPCSLFILWPPKWKRSQREGEKEQKQSQNRFSLVHLCPHPQIYSTSLTLRTGLSHVSSALWLGFWAWLKVTMT